MPLDQLVGGRVHDLGQMSEIAFMLVLPALYQGEQAYILQNDDGRVVFVIPYESGFSLVGTTDVPHEGNPSDAHCTPEEAAYLCAAPAVIAELAALFDPYKAVQVVKHDYKTKHPTTA
mgnify:CR=1 FL=1